MPGSRALAAVVALCLAACSGGPGGDPEARAEVTAAIEALAEAEPATIELGLPDATSEDLNELSIGIEPDLAEALEGARLTIRNDFATDPLEANFSMRVDLAAGSLEARQLEDDVYLRGDTADVFRAFGADPRGIARVIRSRPAFRALARPLLRGDWIHVFGAADYVGGVSLDSGRGRSERAAKAFATAIEESASVTAAGTGSTGAKYQVEIDLARFGEALLEAGEGLFSRPPTQEEIDALPDEQVQLDVWIDDGRLRRVEVDVSQLIDLARGEAAVDRPRLLLRVDVTPFDGELARPRPSARLPAALLFRLLDEA